MKIEELIARVAGKTQGTEGDPLTLEEVGQVVRATLDILYGPGGAEALENEIAVHEERPDGD